jgi:GMP synthase (glutamine-hydrolysing)
VSSPRILVIDGNIAKVRALQTAALGYDSGQGYAQTLKRIDASLEVDILAAADGEDLGSGKNLESYDGVTITGSALNIYNGGEPVTRQLDLARAVFGAGVPFFGSCWGLQVAVSAAGGEVKANPRGREFGFARRIVQSEAGRKHALFAGKPAVFEAPAVHRDFIATLPSNATVLADNDFGLQAATFSHGAGTFWGVQYHPEYDYRDIAAATERYGAILVNEGMFADMQALLGFAADMRVLQTDPANSALLWKHGLGPAMQSEPLRLLEIRNWLNTEVLPRARRT